MPFHYTIRVQIEDTDFAGVVYHSNYLNYFERARSEWVEQLGLGMGWQQEQAIYFAVRSARLDFVKPARLHQWVEVVTEVKEVRNASILFNQYLRLKAAPDTILCRAEIKVACIDKQFKPRALPEKLTLTLAHSFEGDTQ